MKTPFVWKCSVENVLSVRLACNSVQQTARELGISPYHVRRILNKARKQGLKVPQGKRGRPPGHRPQADHVMEVRTRCKTDAEAARLLGVSRQWVHQVRMSHPKGKAARVKTMRPGRPRKSAAPTRR
jgi:transposase